MNKKISYLLVIALISVFAFNSFSFAGKGNVWLVDEKGNQYFTCPVMGKTSMVTEETRYAEFNGEKYYFCCNGCDSKFTKNPEKYIQKMNLPGNVYKVEGKKHYYTCPVSGESDVVSKDTKFAVHEGMKYYFCCNNCPSEFKKDPQKYTGNMGMQKMDVHKHCSCCGAGGCKHGI